jgi:hypothetical protein
MMLRGSQPAKLKAMETQEWKDCPLMEREQNLLRRPFAILLLSTITGL